MQFLTLYGPEIAGSGVFDPVLRDETGAGLPLSTFAFVRGRSAVTEKCNVSPPHVWMALNSLKEQGHVDLTNRVVTLACFEKKEKASTTPLPLRE